MAALTVRAVSAALHRARGPDAERKIELPAAVDEAKAKARR